MEIWGWKGWVHSGLLSQGEGRGSKFRSVANTSSLLYSKVCILKTHLPPWVVFLERQHPSDTITLLACLFLVKLSQTRPLAIEMAFCVAYCTHRSFFPLFWNLRLYFASTSALVFLCPSGTELCSGNQIALSCCCSLKCKWKQDDDKWCFQVSVCLFHCFPYFLRQLVELEEFAGAVKENAEAVEERQETDSIPLIDDIRFHITSNVQTYSAIEEANQKLEALDNLLATIGLEC